MDDTEVMARATKIASMLVDIPKAEHKIVILKTLLGLYEAKLNEAARQASLAAIIAHNVQNK